MSYKLGTVLSIFHIIFHLILTESSEVDIIVPILQRWELRHKEFNTLTKVVQVVRTELEFESGQPGSRDCIFEMGVMLASQNELGSIFFSSIFRERLIFIFFLNI